MLLDNCLMLLRHPVVLLAVLHSASGPVYELLSSMRCARSIAQAFPAAAAPQLSQRRPPERLRIYIYELPHALVQACDSHSFSLQLATALFESLRRLAYPGLQPRCLAKR